MSSSAERDSVVKKTHVRFASKGDDEDDEQDEDTLFDKRNDAGRKLRSALIPKPGCEDRVKVVGGGNGGRGNGGRGNGGRGTCARWVVTLVLCGSSLGLGMSISVLGPTFEDLALNVKKDISNISYIFIGRSGGYIGGSLIGGVLFDCMNPHLLLGFSMILTALGMYAIPFCQQAALLTAFMSSIGVSMGVLDTGGNVLILNTWGDQAGPHMQALHFSFAAGAFVSPVIAKLLFGSDEKGTQLLNATLPVTKAPAPETAFNLKSSLKSMWAYIVIGSFLFLVSVLFFLLYSRCGTVKDQSHSGSGKQLVAKHHLALVFLLFLFFFAYVGAEVAYGSFIFTFAKDFSHMPEAQAAGLNSLFWGTFAATRGFAIFFATCMYPGTMILLCLLGSTLSSLLLCLFCNHKVALWVCTGVYGASMATTFPSGISWLEQYTTITGHTAAVFVVGAALGEMVLPALVGFLLGRFPNQPLLMYLSLLTSTFTAIIFPVMYKLASAPGSPGRKPRVERQIEADDSEYRQALLDSGDNEEEEEEQEDEADQWNDADFEVIEMDDASPPADTGGGEALSSEGCSVGGDSPRHKLLRSLDREKSDRIYPEPLCGPGPEHTMSEGLD